MKLTFLGTGTSQGVPVVACDCQVCQSKDPKDIRLRSSVFIEFKKGPKLLIDIGPDIRQQMLQNNITDIDSILLTHEHNDHTAGLDDIRPINFIQNRDMPIYGLDRVIQDLEKRFHYIFSNSKYPGLPRIVFKRIKNDKLTIIEQEIQVIHVAHGQLPIVGFRFKDLVYITDASHVDDSEIEKIMSCKILIINALRHKKHYSHFSLPEAIAFAQKVKAEHCYFTHISHKLGRYEEVNSSLPANMSLAYDRLELIL